MTDTTREGVGRLIEDCVLAEEVMREGDVFPTGQAIFADVSKTLAAFLTRAEAAEAERDRQYDENVHRITEQAKAEAERDALAAKLALAVEALGALMDLNDNGGPFGGELYRDRVDRAWDNARAALAQLTAAPKEGKDDDL